MSGAARGRGGTAGPARARVALPASPATGSRARVARLALASVAAVLLWPLAGTSPAADALPPTRCADAGAVSRVGDWESVRPPAFRAVAGGRGSAVTEIAVHPSRPQTRYASNGTTVERTDDGGCTWREVYALPEVPSEEDTLSAATSEVVELVVPTDPRAHDRLVLVLRDGNGGPRVLTSVDGGVEPFRDRSEGLPPAGTPTDLMVAATNPDFLFLGVRAVPGEEGGGSGLPVAVPTLPPLPPPLGGDPGGPGGGALTGGLWASVDGGLTWEQRIDTADLEGSTRAVDLVVGHPRSPNRLWVVSDGVLRASTDGGRTYAAKAPSEQQQRDLDWDITALGVDVLSPTAGPAARRTVVLAFSRTSAQDGGPVMLSSVDEGATFDQVRGPGVVDSMSPFVPGTGAFALSTLAVDGRPGVRVVNVRSPRPTQLPVKAPPVDAPDLAVTTDRSASPTFHARTADRLLRYVGPAAAVPPALPPVIGGSQEDAIAPLGAAAVAPDRDEVVLEVGESRTLPHVLTTPRRLTPLDVYVLLDTSESMADDLDAVRGQLRALATRLRDRGLDLSIGLGEFKGGRSTVAYRRVVGVGPSTGAFSRGLDELVADGFGLEAQLIALEQALTGRGETAADLLPADCKLTDPDPDRFVQEERRTAPPVVGGQAADFRRGAVPVVLVVTDTNFLRPAGTPLKPDCSVDVDRVASAYAAAGVHVVGLGVDDVDNAPRAADMTAFARATGAMQPPGQACAPMIDATPGAPAVCREALDLVPTLERLAGQQREPAVLTVAETGAADVLDAGVTAFPGVDLRRSTTLDLPVTYSCAGQEPGTYDGGVEVRLAGVAVATITSRVTCLAAAGALPPAAVVVPPVVGVLPLPGAAPPPPPPAQVVQPQVQTQPQANPQVQSGAQEDSQEQVDLALALQTGLQQDDRTELAMSARRPAVPVPVHLAALTALTAGAAGLALRQQARERARLVPQVARVTRRTR
jgi:hypothetical protein